MPVEDKEKIGKVAGTLGYRKPITPRERHFAKLIAVEGEGGVGAARIAFGWRCEPGSKENDKARNLARAPRIAAEIKKIKEQMLAEQKVKESIRLDFGEMHKGDLREFTFKILEHLRDNPNTKAANRFNAIKMLKKLHDPGKDINLIYKWIDLAWRYQTAHCPCCHKSFALAEIKNEKLDKWREQTKADTPPEKLESRFDRQMEIISRCDPQRTPHPGQIRVYSAPERHIVSEGAARSGKSYTLAMIATMAICLPGVEIWLLAETFNRANKEIQYLENFLNALFFPHYKQIVSTIHDKKTGETIISTKWGSEVRVKSSKSKGSITASALEFALCAEPGWLPADIYEELRARMSERLGRIIAIGTPKGLGGFIGRMTNMYGRDPRTGNMIRWKREERLIENGCPWGSSMLITRFDPLDNPEFVKSELEAARMELTDEEYASEFEGIGVSAEGAKFGLVREDHLKMVEESFWKRAVFLLGIDQGPKNFGACLIGYDGTDIVVTWEYFDSNERTTMKRNLLRLRSRVPRWIEALGGNPEHWTMTITDQDPMLDPIFAEMEEEGQPWPTDISKRHKNFVKIGENWRRENQEFVNNMARHNHLWFNLVDLPFVEENESPGAYLLHDQVRQCIDVQEDREKESKVSSLKGWSINDPIRGDHCFHPDTDVLTAQGWKKIKDVSKDELVMSRTPNGEIIWVQVTNTISKFYEGIMYSYGGKFDGASFMVTPDHNLYVQDMGKNLKFIKCIDFVNAKGHNQDKKGTSKFYKIPIRSKPIKLGNGLNNSYGFNSGNSFAYFLGFFLAEGCTHPNRSYIHIDQKDKNILEKIQKTKINTKGSIYQNKKTKVYRLSFYDHELYTFLSKNPAHKKRIPRWFFDNASISEHEQLFKGLMDGDGTWSQRKYDSTSEGLIDDFQELTSRLGVVSSKVQTESARIHEVPNARFSLCKPCYRVRYRRLDKQNAYLTLRHYKMKPISYKGLVYCISAPPYNVIFTRYKGKTMWIGQCLDAWYMAIWLICSQQVRLPKFENAEIANDPWAREKQRFEQELAAAEKKELGITTKEPRSAQEAWQKLVHGENRQLFGGYIGHYGNDA